MKTLLTFILVALLAFGAQAEVLGPNMTIKIQANFDASVGSSSSIVVKLNNGELVTLNNTTSNGPALWGYYLHLASHPAVPDLAIDSIISGSVFNHSNSAGSSYLPIPFSPGDLVFENSFIARNFGDVKDVALSASFINPYIRISVDKNPYGISAPVNIGGTEFIYVASQGEGTVQKINTTTRTIAATYGVGSEPYGLVKVNVSGTDYIFVANTGSNTVSVINTSTGAITSINVGLKPYYIVTSGGMVYVTNSLTNTVSVINASSQSVVATVPVGTYPRSLAFYGSSLYVANYGDSNYGGGNSLSVLDISNNTNTLTIPLPLGDIGPRGVTLARGAYIFVTNYLSDSVSLINPVYNKPFPTTEDGQTGVPSRIIVGRGPRGILSANSVNKVYVENFDEGSISVINSLNFTVIKKVYVGHSPSGMSLVGNDLYISCFQDNNIYILDITTDKLK